MKEQLILNIQVYIMPTLDAPARTKRRFKTWPEFSYQDFSWASLCSSRTSAELVEAFSRTPLPSATPDPRIPDYVRFDKKVLVFDAYFTEVIPNSATEKQRDRVVKIYYHLEDDTITVIEPHILVSADVQYEQYVQYVGFDAD